MTDFEWRFPMCHFKGSLLIKRLRALAYVASLMIILQKGWPMPEKRLDQAIWVVLELLEHGWRGAVDFLRLHPDLSKQNSALFCVDQRQNTTRIETLSTCSSNIQISCIWDYPSVSEHYFFHRWVAARIHMMRTLWLYHIRTALTWR